MCSTSLGGGLKIRIAVGIPVKTSPPPVPAIANMGPHASAEQENDFYNP